jgi:hypothetical protein
MIDQKEAAKVLAGLDPVTWILDNKLELSHGPWTLKNHEYQADWRQCDAPRQCFIKGAQIGASECLVLKTLHGMIHNKYKAGSLYLFPTRDDVGDFSKARFDPLINQNSCVRYHVQNTDSKNIKQIGRGFLYLRGARVSKSIGGQKKSSSQLKSIPVDRIVFDERDEMEDSMVTLAEERVSHSQVEDGRGRKGEIIYLGTPTIPDYGIDELYKKSDQRAWVIRCQACNKDTCLDLEFPNGLTRQKDGSVFRSCIHCGKEIHPVFGRWEPLYPDRSKDLVGWWISQLNAPYMNPTNILNLYENPPHNDLSEIMNSKLGRAYIPAENRLHPNEVYSCCGNDAFLLRHDGPTCMGVDVGRQLHVVVAERKTRSTLKVVWIGRLDTFSELHDIAQNMNVRAAVIDLRPEIRKVRDFQRQENYQVFGCEYIEQRAGQIAWDEKDLLVKVNRTEICDATHDLAVEFGKLELPRRNAEIDRFVTEMCNIAKVLEEDNQTGARIYRYKRLGSSRPDHYRHAMNYCLLAAERTGVISDSKIIQKFFSRRRGRSWLSV